MPISIKEFFETTDVDESFDEKLYALRHPDLEKFCQPYCKENNIDEKHRLYYHYITFNPRYTEKKIDKQNKVIALKVHNGLGTRLKTINSFLSFAQKINALLKVNWPFSSGFSNEHFLDLFEPIEEIEFLTEKEFNEYKRNLVHFNSLFVVSAQGDKDKYNFSSEQYDILNNIARNGFCYEGADCAENIFESVEASDALYDKICLNNSVELGIDSSLMIGVHMRRGKDIETHPKKNLYKLSDDQYFLDQMRQEIIKDENVKFFLSTDCERTNELMMSYFPNRITYNTKKKFTDTVHYFCPKFNQKDAAIDLFLLSKTKKIIGSNYSNFSFVASKIGKKNLTLPKSSANAALNINRKSNLKIFGNRKANKIILYTQAYNASTEVLTYKIYCLYKNISNKNIDQIILLSEANSNFQNVFNDKVIIHPIEERLTYKKWIEISSEMHPKDIKVLANSDIYFDQTIDKLRRVKNWDPNILYACSRKDETKQGSLVPSKLYHSEICPAIDIERSQDVWIYKNKLKEFNSDYCLGLMGCDTFLGESLKSAGMKLVNLYFDINSIHVDWRVSKDRGSYFEHSKAKFF